MLKLDTSFLRTKIFIMQKILTKNILLALVFLILTLLTRASHELTAFSLPDASIAIFIAASIYLKQRKWLFLFLASIISIDAYIVNLNDMTHINFETSYLGHIFTYIITWELGRKFLSGNKFLKANLYFPIAILAIVLSYIISFSSYYFLSGWTSNPNIYDGLTFLRNYFNSFFIPNTVYVVILYVIFKINQKIPKLTVLNNTSN